MGIWNLKPLIIAWVIISSIIIGTGIYIDNQTSSFEYELEIAPAFRIEIIGEPLVDRTYNLLAELNDIPTIDEGRSVVYWEHRDRLIINKSVDTLISIVYVNPNFIEDLDGLDFPVLYNLPQFSSNYSLTINLIAEGRQLSLQNFTAPLLLPDYLNQIISSLGQSQLPRLFMPVNNITTELNSFEYAQQMRDPYYTTGINLYFDSSVHFSSYDEFLDHYDEIWRLCSQKISTHYDMYNINTPLLSKISSEVSYNIFLASYITIPIMMFLLVLEIVFIAGFSSMINDLKRIYNLLENRGVSRKTLNMKLYLRIFGYHLLFSSLTYLGLEMISTNNSFKNEMLNFILPSLSFFILSSSYVIVYSMKNLNMPPGRYLKRIPMMRLLDLAVILSVVMISVSLLTASKPIEMSELIEVDVFLFITALSLNLLYRKQFVLIKRTSVINKLYLNQYRIKNFIVLVSILGIILISMMYSSFYIDYQYGSSVDGNPPHPLFSDLEGTINMQEASRSEMQAGYRLISNRLDSISDFNVFPVINLGVFLGDEFIVIQLLNESQYNKVAVKMGMETVNFTEKIFMNQGMYDSLVQGNDVLQINDYEKNVAVSSNTFVTVGSEFGIETHDWLITSVSTWKGMGFSLFHRLGNPDGVLLDLIINSPDAVNPRDTEIVIIEAVGISDSRVMVRNVDRASNIQAISQNVGLIYYVLIFALVVLNSVIILNTHDWAFMEVLKTILSRYGVLKSVLLSGLLIAINLLLVSTIGIFLGVLLGIYYMYPSILTINLVKLSVYSFMDLDEFILGISLIVIVLGVFLGGIITQYNIKIRKNITE